MKKEEKKDYTKEWLQKKLNLCGYKNRQLNLMFLAEIDGCMEPIYEVLIEEGGEWLRYVALKKGQCMDLITTSISVKEMLGKDDEWVIPENENYTLAMLPESQELLERGDIWPNTIFKFNNYVLAREHFFVEGKFVQLAVCVRTREYPSFSLGQFGRYRLVTLITDPELK